MTGELAGALLAGFRWLTFIALVGLIGAAGARLVVRRVTSGPFTALRSTLDRHLARAATVFSLGWLISLAGVLAANLVVWFGPTGLTDPSRLEVMLFQTRWGQSWLTTFLAAIGATLALGVSIRLQALRPMALAIATIAAILPTPLIGHAAGHGTLMWALHAVHLLGVGLWLGTLLLLAWPTWSLWREVSPSPFALRQMLTAFTPVALTGAGLSAASGTWMALAHIWPPTTVTDTPYGVTLIVKLAVVAVIGALGWRNWQRFRPHAEEPEGRRSLRRAVIAELTLGLVVVLGITAWLSGLPTPM